MRRGTSLVQCIFAIFCAVSVMAAEYTAYVTKNANVRARPTTSAPIVATLDAGTKIYVNDEVDGWRAVFLESDKKGNQPYGYIHTSLITNVTPIGIGEPAKYDCDLEGKMVNGVKVYPELSIDEVTDKLGRPTAVKDRTVMGAKYETVLYYCDEGLAVHFGPSDKLSEVVVYLSKTWLPEIGEWMTQYRGSISYNISGDWKVQKIEKL
ncbi:SH3 domain-containing protein, partial [Deferrisoma palaeochoriense]